MKRIKGACIVVAFGITFYLALSRINLWSGLLSGFVGLAAPFIIGLVIAFILNIPMTALETRVFSRVAARRGKKAGKLARLLSLVATYAIVIAVITLLLRFVLPQLIESITKLSNSIPGFLVSVQRWAEKLALGLNLSDEMWKSIVKWLESLVGSVLGLIPELFGMLPQVYGLVVSVGGGMFNALIGVVVSVYLLLSKETLMSQLVRLNHAFLPKQAAGFLAHTGALTVRTLRNYIAGQVTDAVIVGVVCVLILSIGRFPYAMLIGVVMGFTNIIPFFGPFIGFIPGFFILLMVDPMRALAYSVIVIVVQQIDGNIIVPKVVGDSIGLPPLWVLVSVTLGGGMFGIVGMVLGMPVFAVIYQLLGEAVRYRERVNARSDDELPPPTDAPA